MQATGRPKTTASPAPRLRRVLGRVAIDRIFHNDPSAGFQSRELTDARPWTLSKAFRHEGPAIFCCPVTGAESIAQFLAPSMLKGRAKAKSSSREWHAQAGCGTVSLPIFLFARRLNPLPENFNVSLMRKRIRLRI
jgi:hypothetical protein